ncbi:MAG: DNA-binding response regulator [Bacteroidetes bacterium HGW-Bacteroidetes-4]|nr:MAG: DNA-binding response regulator [Bacteroidetes bacterium HGW-Bacteroidetes-4]
MNTKTNNTIIADSQFLITESLKIIIQESANYNFIGLATNVLELDDLLSLRKAHLLITDFAKLDWDGFGGLKKIKIEYPELSILILTNKITRKEFNEFSSMGITNIIYKSSDAEELLTAMDATVKGRKYYSEEVLDLFLEANNSRKGHDEAGQLTPTEIEITKLIAAGLNTKGIAEQKNISFHTVMSHRKNIFRKLKINSAQELVMYAIKAGLIDNIEYYI